MAVETRYCAECRRNTAHVGTADHKVCADCFEDELDRQAAAKALKEVEEQGTVPWEEVKAKLGL